MATPPTHGALQQPPARRVSPGQVAAPQARPQRADAPGQIRVPERPSNALGGEAFFASIGNLRGMRRDAAIRDEILRGNVPSFMRQLQEIRFSYTGPSGSEHAVSLFVLPDYLAVGSDENYVRVPISPQAAQAIADRFGAVLPTRQLVDRIYQSASARLPAHTVWGNRAPRGMTQEQRLQFMSTTEAFVWHNAQVQQEAAAIAPGTLVAGHKKDVVITNRLRGREERVAIYGWHGTDGKPIQPLSTIHEREHIDYSHGARLVGATMLVDGRPMSVEEVLRNPELAGALSDEGVISRARYR